MENKSKAFAKLSIAIQAFILLLCVYKIWLTRYEMEGYKQLVGAAKVDEIVSGVNARFINVSILSVIAVGISALIFRRGKYEWIRWIGVILILLKYLLEDVLIQ